MAHRVRARTAWIAALGVALAVGLAVGLGHSGGHPAQGSGVRAQSTRSLPPFFQLELAAANDVTVRVGSPQSVVVRGDDNLLRLVTTRVRGGRLIISARRSFSTQQPMSVLVTVPSLDTVVLSGSGRIRVAAVRAVRFSADLQGSGTVTAGGHATALDATIGGSGTLGLERLVALDAHATIDGSGYIGLRATGSLDATIQGSGQINYVGRPQRVRTHVSGSGTVG